MATGQDGAGHYTTASPPGDVPCPAEMQLLLPVTRGVKYGRPWRHLGWVTYYVGCCTRTISKALGKLGTAGE